MNGAPLLPRDCLHGNRCLTLVCIWSASRAQVGLLLKVLLKLKVGGSDLQANRQPVGFYCSKYSKKIQWSWVVPACLVLQSTPRPQVGLGVPLPLRGWSNSADRSGSYSYPFLERGQRTSLQQLHRQHHLLGLRRLVGRYVKPAACAARTHSAQKDAIIFIPGPPSFRFKKGRHG